MGRNMFRRIEVAWAVRDAALRQRVIDECLVPYLHDGRDAWLQAPDGSYRRVGDDGPSAQAALMVRYGADPAAAASTPEPVAAPAVERRLRPRGRR
jgi:polyphosphate kinase